MNRGVQLVLLAMMVIGFTDSVPQCLKFRWVGQEGSPMQGIRIAGTESYSQQVAYLDDKNTSAECFYECCVRGVELDSCNAASFYKDAEGKPHCFLLFCDPFTDCQWTLSYKAEEQSAFMAIVRETNGGDIQKVAIDIEKALEWNIVNEETTAAPQTTTATILNVADVTSVTNVPVAPTKSAETVTTAAPAATTAAKATTLKPQHETEALDMTQVASTEAAPPPPAEPTSEASDDVTSGSNLKSFVVENESEGVNKTAIIVCSLGGVALLVAGVVIAIKRYQVEKDRSVYRPLMDDMHSRGFKESDPLH